MNGTVSSNNFGFYRGCFEKNHHTDNSGGAPLNYVAYMLKGSARIVSEHKTINVNEGDVFFIPYRLPYQSYWYGSNTIEFLSYGFFALEAAEKINFDLQVVECDEELKALIKKIPLDGHSPSCGTLSSFYSAMARLIPCLKKSRRASKTQEVVDRAKKYILEHTDCSMEEVAKSCYVSEPYLYMCFKQKACCAPNEYRLKAISRRGTGYLITTDKSVEEISSLLGMSSAAHFRRVLKKYTGLTPREIRKNSNF